MTDPYALIGVRFGEGKEHVVRADSDATRSITYWATALPTGHTRCFIEHTARVVAAKDHLDTEQLLRADVYVTRSQMPNVVPITRRAV